MNVDFTENRKEGFVGFVNLTGEQSNPMKWKGLFSYGRSVVCFPPGEREGAF